MLFGDTHLAGRLGSRLQQKRWVLRWVLMRGFGGDTETGSVNSEPLSIRLLCFT